MSEETKKTSEEQEAEKEIPVTDGDQEEENLTPEGEDLPEEENKTPGEEAASEDKKEEKSKTSFFGKKKKDKSEQKVEELTDRLKRTMAEFDNFRKRTEKEKSSMYIFGSLTLSIVEVSRNCDNCLCYFLTKICLCILFQFLKDHCGDLLWRIFLIVDRYTVICTHLSLDG